MNRNRRLKRGLKYVLLMLLAVVLVSGLAGCLGKEPQSKPQEPPVQVAFALADLERDGNKTIKETVDKEKEKARARVTWLDARGDPAEQQKQLAGLGKKRIKAVVLQPVDMDMAPALVEQLKRDGIRVVALDSLPLNTAVDGYITPDHTLVGRLQARFVLEALRRAGEARAGGSAQGGQGAGQGGQQGSGGGSQEGGTGGGGSGGGSAGGTGGQTQGPGAAGAVDFQVLAQLPQHRPLRVVILGGDPKDQAARTITASLRNELQQQPDVSLVGVYEHPGFDPAGVSATVAEIMGSGGGVDVILANDSTLAMAAVDFLQMGGHEKKILTVGAGADEKASRALVEGKHDAEVDLQPEMLGRFALEAAVALANTGQWSYSATVENGDYSIPARVVPVRLITPGNAYLLEERWQGLAKAQEGQQQAGAGQGGGQTGGGKQQGDQQQGGDKQQQQGQGQGGSGEQSGSPGKSTLRITTRDGKTMEVQIDGQVEKIESLEGGGKQGQDQQSQGGGGQNNSSGGQ